MCSTETQYECLLSETNTAHTSSAARCLQLACSYTHFVCYGVLVATCLAGTEDQSLSLLVNLQELDRDFLVHVVVDVLDLCTIKGGVRQGTEAGLNDPNFGEDELQLLI